MGNVSVEFKVYIFTYIYTKLLYTFAYIYCSFYTSYGVQLNGISEKNGIYS
jgi:hypothetical protein